MMVKKIIETLYAWGNKVYTWNAVPKKLIPARNAGNMIAFDAYVKNGKYVSIWTGIKGKYKMKIKKVI